MVVVRNSVSNTAARVVAAYVRKMMLPVAVLVMSYLTGVGVAGVYAQDSSIAYDLFDDGKKADAAPAAATTTASDEAASELAAYRTQRPVTVSAPQMNVVNPGDVPANVDVEGVRSMKTIEIIGTGQKYTLGTDDVVQVTVRNQPDFSGYFIIGPEGFIQYNWCGDVKAEGLTKEELQAELEKRLAKFVRYPEVSVQIMEYNSKAVYVVGSVTKPGKYPMKGDHIKLRDALVAAGLPTGESALGRAKIVRETENGPQEIEVDLKALLYKGELDKNYELQPGDIVNVPMSRFVKTTNAMSQTFGPVFQAAAIYSVGKDISGGGDD